MAKSFDPAVHRKKRYFAAGELRGRQRAGDNRGVAFGRKTSKWENKKNAKSSPAGKKKKKTDGGKKKSLAVVFGCGGGLGGGGRCGRGPIVEVICLICCFWSEECRDWERLISSACSERCKYYGTSVVTLKRRYWFGRRARRRGLVGRLWFSCTKRPVASFGGSASCGRPWEREGMCSCVDFWALDEEWGMR